MKVEIFRLTNEPVIVEVTQDGTVKDVFTHPDSGKVLRHEGTLLEAANELYGGIERLGTLRVNGVPATLETHVTEGATILIIPKVEGGV
jgi:molybdopterin converting factor small subunit